MEKEEKGKKSKYLSKLENLVLIGLEVYKYHDDKKLDLQKHKDSFFSVREFRSGIIFFVRKRLPEHFRVSWRSFLDRRVYN